jgi:hypothetical protein
LSVVIAGYAVERFWVRDSVVASAPTPAVVETPPENSEQQKPPESDVARERAALDRAEGVTHQARVGR